MPGDLPQELAFLVLNALPVDVTFVDQDGVIRYYTGHRIFKRTPDILGTNVLKCHHAASRPAVAQVIDDLKSGRAEVIEQLSKKGGRPVRVQYLAVRGARGEYVGMVEMCQWVSEKKPPATVKAGKAPSPA